MNHLQYLIRTGLITIALILSACSSGKQGKANYVDSAGPRTIVSLDRINIQDWSNAADQMVHSLLDSGVLQRSPEQPAILVISRIINNTTQQIDTDELTKKIRVALNKSGKVLTTTTFGLPGQVEDPIAQTVVDQQRFQTEEPTSSPLPYFSLSGKLLESRAQTKKAKQVTYTFQLSLTETKSGLAVWEDEVLITKQGTGSSIGW